MCYKSIIYLVISSVKHFKSVIVRVTKLFGDILVVFKIFESKFYFTYLSVFTYPF